MIKLWPDMKIDTDVLRGFVLGLILICMSLSMAFENNGLDEDAVIQRTEEGMNAPGFVFADSFLRTTHLHPEEDTIAQLQMKV